MAGSRVIRIVPDDVFRPGGHYSHARRFGEMDLWRRFNAVYAEVMGEAKPARTVVPVPELHHGYLIEIDAIAACADARG